MHIFNAKQGEEGKSIIVKFESEQETKKALELLNNKEIDDEKLRTKEVKDNRYCDCNNKHNKKFGKIRQFKFYELKGVDGNVPLIHFLHGFQLKYNDLLSQLN